MACKTYMSTLSGWRLMIRFLRFFSGLNRGGIDSHVFRPMTTTFSCDSGDAPVVTVGSRERVQVAKRKCDKVRQSIMLGESSGWSCQPTFLPGSHLWQSTSSLPVVSMAGLH